MSKQKQALGKGLGALLPTDESTEDQGSDISKTRLYNFDERMRAVGRVSELTIDLIDPNPFQPRTDFDRGALQELAQSIQHLGIIQPITVRSTRGGRYELISGERRLRACVFAGLAKIPAFVREADTESMLEMALVENVQRESLNPIEVALGYQRLMDECGLKQEDVARKVGKNRTTIANFLRLLKLPPPILSALKSGSISTGHARAMLSIENPAQQTALLERTIRDGLSVRAVEELAKAYATSTPKKKTSAKGTGKAGKRSLSPEMEAVRSSLRNCLSTQVAIRPASKGQGGRVEIEYYSLDDLERLVELMLK